MAKTLLLLIIAFVTLDFVISSVLSWLNTKWMTHPVPPELEGLYDDEKYRKQQDYMRTNKRVSLIARCVSFALTLVILGFGLLGWLDNQCKAWTDVPVLQVILFLVIYNLFNTVIALPFSYYSTFVIEERFGFNRTTHKTFWLDAVKSFAVSTVLSAVLLGVVYWLYQTFGHALGHLGGVRNDIILFVQPQLFFRGKLLRDIVEDRGLGGVPGILSPPLRQTHGLLLGAAHMRHAGGLEIRVRLLPQPFELGLSAVVPAADDLAVDVLGEALPPLPGAQLGAQIRGGHGQRAFADEDHPRGVSPAEHLRRLLQPGIVLLVPGQGHDRAFGEDVVKPIPLLHRPEHIRAYQEIQLRILEDGGLDLPETEPAGDIAEGALVCPSLFQLIREEIPGTAGTLNHDTANITPIL